MEKTLSVAAISSGTVIDHIAAGNALTIVKLLRLPEVDHLVTIGLNLPSGQLNKKDLVKVEGKVITEAEANRIAIIAPEATINIIENYSVQKKWSVSLPETIIGFIVCPNPHCISNHETMDAKFFTSKKHHAVSLRCHYCEKIFTKDDIRDFTI